MKISGSVVDRIVKSKIQLAKNMVCLARYNNFSDPWNMPWDLYLDTIEAVIFVAGEEEKAQG